MRLLSPQHLFNAATGVHGRFEGTESQFILHFSGFPRLVLKYNTHNHLPIGYASTAAPSVISPAVQLLLVFGDSNQNITAVHKLLLHWHARFGHLNFQSVQRLLRNFPFDSPNYSSAAKCDLTAFWCEICQYAKAFRRTTHDKLTHVNPERDVALKNDLLSPGARVSVDYFVTRLLGRTFTSLGAASAPQYIGECVFVDHGTGFVHVEHQVGFSSVETIRAKQNYENME